MFRRYFVPPLIPFLILVGICVWVQVAPAPGGEGDPDGAPYRAANVLLLLSPIYLVLCFFLNGIDGCFDAEESRLRQWMWSLLLAAMLVSAGSCCLLIVSEGPGESAGDLRFVGLSVALTLLPMSLARRLLGGSGEAPVSLWSTFVGMLGRM